MKQRREKYPRIANYLFLAIIFVILLWITIFGQNSYLNTLKLEHKVRKLERETLRLQAINDSLAKENARLKTDPEAAEKAARELFGLTKPDEKVFRFVPAKEDK